MRVIDISGPIYTDMWSYCKEYPGAVIEELPQPQFLEDKYEVFCQKFIIGGQSGTYIETRAHVDKNAPPVVDYPLEEFVMDCVVIKLKEKGPLQPITLKDLKCNSPEINRGDAVLLSCGWDKRWREPDFVSKSPYISKEAAQWLLEHDIKLLGGDFPRFDNVEKMEFPWDLFWEKATFLLAPLTNLRNVKEERVILVSFPLKIEGAVASPCRAAIIEGVGVRT